MKHVVQRATVTIAAGALLAVGMAAAPATAAVAATPTELLISEYVEGSSNNKAIEIYNPTEAAVDLSQYRLRVYFNGSHDSHRQSGAQRVPLAAGDAFVFAMVRRTPRSSPSPTRRPGPACGTATTRSSSRRGGTVVDSIGQVGIDPGTQWGTDLTSTADNTLRRAASVCVGDTVTERRVRPGRRVGRLRAGHVRRTGIAHRRLRRRSARPVINEFSASTDRHRRRVRRAARSSPAPT